MNLFKLTAEVVRIGNLLLVWINHLQQAVVAVVCPLRHIGCTGVSLAKIHKWSRLTFLYKNVNHGLKLYTLGVQTKTIYDCVRKVYMS